VVHDDETGEVLADLTEPNQTYVVAKGGKGGLGNSHFKTSTRQTPRIAELGEPGEEKTVKLELRIIADVGIVGLPNAARARCSPRRRPPGQDRRLPVHDAPAEPRRRSSSAGWAARRTS
jgi:hypothetical protein